MATDIKRTKVPIQMVFDVGANKGQSTDYFLTNFPGTIVHAFEPTKENFEQLSKLESQAVVTRQLALGKEPGKVKIYLSKNPQKHSTVIVENEDQYEIVAGTTIDRYCEENSIAKIGLLKIDTEGADLEVLEGASKMIGRGKVEFAFVESSFYHGSRHVFINEFLEFFSRHGYYVMGVYDQSMEWSRQARIQYLNILFARGNIKIPR